MFKPYENDAQSMQIGELIIENQTDKVIVYGDIDIMKTTTGLSQARQLQQLFTDIVSAIERTTEHETVYTDVAQEDITEDNNPNTQKDAAVSKGGSVGSSSSVSDQMMDDVINDITGDGASNVTDDVTDDRKPNTLLDTHLADQETVVNSKQKLEDTQNISEHNKQDDNNTLRTDAVAKNEQVTRKEVDNPFAK